MLGELAGICISPIPALNHLAPNRLVSLGRVVRRAIITRRSPGSSRAATRWGDRPPPILDPEDPMKPMKMIYVILGVATALLVFLGWKLTARSGYESADYTAARV